MTTTHSTMREAMTAAERRMYACPIWCERWDHEAQQPSDEDPPFHYGPDFGVIGLQAQGGEPIAAFLDEPQTDMDPDALRQLAAHAVAAAEWLEAHQ